MNINIDKILKKQGKTRYWLSKEINYSYPNLVKLANNKTSSINFLILENICIALNCTPNDLFLMSTSTEK